MSTPFSVYSNLYSMENWTLLLACPTIHTTRGVILYSKILPSVYDVKYHVFLKDESEGHIKSVYIRVM